MTSTTPDTAPCFSARSCFGVADLGFLTLIPALSMIEIALAGSPLATPWTYAASSFRSLTTIARFALRSAAAPLALVSATACALASAELSLATVAREDRGGLAYEVVDRETRDAENLLYE
jgi:hypothetical protein